MSTLRADTISNSGGTKSVPTSTVVDGTAKAWVNFNGSGTPAIRAAFNVTSITDRATGAWTINFTNAMTDTNYAMVLGHGTNSPGNTWTTSEDATLTRTTSAVGINTNAGGTAFDATQLAVAIFR